MMASICVPNGNVHRATQAIESEERADTAPFDRKLPTIAAIYQRHLIDIDYGFFGHFATVSRTSRTSAARVSSPVGAL